MHLNRKVATIAISVFLITSIALLANPVEQAQAQLAAQQPVSGPLPAGVTVNTTVPTFACLSFRPNPVGVNQVFMVNLWTTTAPGANRFHQDYTVTITKPDGTKNSVVMDSFVADGTAWFEYVADQIGEWKLKFDFLGEYYPAGRYLNGYIVTNSSGNTYDSCYYQPSSTKEQALTVQTDPVLPWPETPLPTDYWTRPITPYGRAWWPILGNYPWHGMGLSYYGPSKTLWDQLYPGSNPYWSSQQRFTPWVQGPNSAHIVWKRQGVDAGIVGGDVGAESIAPGGIQGLPVASTPDIIYNGRCYDTVTKAMPTMVNGTVRTLPVTVWQCYDLRTGEVYWELTDVTAPSLIEYEIRAESVPGAQAAGGMTVNLLALSGNRMIKYNPFTGAVTANISIPVTGTYYKSGYCLAVQDLGSSAGANRYRLINWTTAGTSTDFSSRIITNTTYARSSLPSLIDWGAGYGAQVSGITRAGAYVGSTLLGFNLQTGLSLWNVTIDETQYSGSCNIADHGKVATLAAQGYYIAYDLASGTLAWKSEKMDYPWDESAFGAYSVQSAYGLLYHEGYGGLYAFNWTNGKIAWKYESPADYQYETPYTGKNGTTVNPFDAGAIVADGKIYVGNEEHSSTQPLTRGWKFHCVNALTGEGIWNIEIPGLPGAIADGYLTMASLYNGYMYVFGKGKSTTTVTAPQTQISLGTGVLIQGTLLDQSPAQPGTPCISKESMGVYMEYLHAQKPIPSGYTVTGVPIQLLAVDENGTVSDLGSVTSDVSGSFQKEWTPPNEGLYKITATFAGDDSYDSSWAETGLSVGPAPATIHIPEQITPPDYTLAIVGSALAVIVAVAIVGILVVKKK